MKRFLEFIEGSIFCGAIFFKIFTILIFYIMIIFLVYQFITTNTKSLYKENWNIEIPNPNHHKYLIDLGHDSLEEMNYSEKDIKELQEKDFIEKIDKENIENLKEKYNNLMNNFFIDHLSEEDRKKFVHLKLENLISENNYYALIEENSQNSEFYKFLIFLIDIESNTLYSIIYKSHIR